MAVRRTRKATTRKAATPNAQASAKSTTETQKTVAPKAEVDAAEAVAKAAPTKADAANTQAAAKKATAASQQSTPKVVATESGPVVPEKAAAVSSNRPSSVPKAAATTTVKSTKQGNSSMSQEEVKIDPTPVKAKANSKGAIVQKTPSLSIWESPIMPSEIEMVGTLQMAGTRPVAASSVGVFGTILNGRPIQSSELKIYEPLSDGSAIFFSDFHSVEGLDLPGGRPVMESPSGLMAAEKLPGDRPIFSNETDNAYELMGFLD